MTDNEIIKALECCGKYKNCFGCPLKPIKGINPECYYTLLTNTLDLINRLQAEKSNLEIELKAMRGAANSYKAENERLKAKVNHYNYCYENFVNTPISRIKAEAYKEFVERLKENTYYNMAGDNIVFEHDIDNLLKEMVGEDK